MTMYVQLQVRMIIHSGGTGTVRTNVSTVEYRTV